MLFSKLFKRKRNKITPEHISLEARKVIRTLKRAHFDAFIVGGAVRDILMGRQPKDFDITTNASPEQIRRLFRNSRIIGRRFKIVHVFFGRRTNIEVATFRAHKPHDSDCPPDMLVHDNDYGTLEEDVLRRDFTANALYYDPQTGQLIDHVNGINDIQAGILKLIGEPEIRFHEDPVRMLRAIRIASKLGLTVDPKVDAAIDAQYKLLEGVPKARLFDESLKLFFQGYAEVTYQALIKKSLMHFLFPGTNGLSQSPKYPHYQKLWLAAMQETDRRFHAGLSLNPGYLYATLLWPALQEYLFEHKQENFFPVLHQGIQHILEQQTNVLVIPQRLQVMMRAVWTLQYHMKRRRGKRVYHVAEHRYFRAAIDFLELRTRLGEPVGQLAGWWREFEKASDKHRAKMVAALKP